jgi:hypothetical protein
MYKYVTMDNVEKTNKLSELILGRLYCLQDTEVKGKSIDPLHILCKV